MKNIILGLLLAFLFPGISFAQSTDQNYIRKTRYKGENATQPAVEINYLDGLGRNIQTVLHKQAGNGNNIVIPAEYNEYGIQVKEFLPYVRVASEDYDPNAINNVHSFYNNASFDYAENPYTETLTEKAPLNRTLMVAFAGDTWKMGGGNEIKKEYKIIKESDQVVFFSSNPVYNSSTRIFDYSLIRVGLYPANSLTKNVIKNENWKSTQEFILDNTVEEYVDDSGKVILKRAYNNNIKHDTYFVYDPYGNLTHIIPPEVYVSGQINALEMEMYCYQYKYDTKNRLVEKKMPDKGWEYIVYDKQDRIVFTQDSRQKGVEWNFVKYDKQNRIVYSGLYNSVRDRSTEQAALDKRLQTGIPTRDTSNNESKSALSFANNGVDVYYDNNAYPKTNMVVTNVYYYDNYEYIGADNFESFEGHDLLNVADKKLKGKITANFTNILKTTQWNKNYFYYDNKYLNQIKSEQKNHLGGYTIVQNKIDFSNKILKKQTRHKRIASEEELKITEEYIYTDQDLLSDYSHQINTSSKQNISYGYDPLKRLVKKNILGESTGDALQKVDYKYNIRGWMTDINNVEDIVSDNDLFALKLNYEHRGGLMKGVYDGKISSTLWRTKTDNIIRRYVYFYDNLSRLIDAQDFYVISSGSFNGLLVQTGKFREKVSYGKNGNIDTLLRTGDDYSGQIVEIDDLHYTYRGNRLMDLRDDSNNPDGFRDNYTDDDDYDYDVNGNLHVDRSKGISLINYNHLNLPTEIIFANGKIEYVYDANGQKVSKKVIPISGNTLTTHYLNGFQYQNNSLEFFQIPEGYVEVKNGQYLYTYQYKDHLGNTRITYREGYNRNTGLEDPSLKDGMITQEEIIEENNYYPFGLKHSYNNLASPGANQSALKYRYGGKEYQDELGLDFYDFGARNYDPAIARWINMDPLAEKYPAWTPYHYVHNNPTNMIDPTGKSAEWIPGTDNKAISYSRNEKGEIVWSSNTPDKFIELGNEMLKTEKGTEQLNKAINSDDVRVDVILNEDRKVGESGPFGDMTFGTASPNDAEYDSNGIPKRITDATINLYPEAYEDVIDYISKNPELKGSFDINYDGHIINPANYSIMGNTSTTFGHEIEHVFDPVSSSFLNRANKRSNNPEENPNKVSKEIYQQLD